MHDGAGAFSCRSQPFASPGSLSQSAQPGLQDATAQVPLAHVAVAFGIEHVTPHAPQFVNVVVDVSQPLFGLPSQSPHPELQTGTHRPDGQLVVPFEFVHDTPHPPHEPMELRLVSHPLLGLPSQSP